jgi:tryptophan-rich sensory protein
VSFGYVFWLYFQGKVSKWVVLPFVLNLLFNFSFTYVQFTLRSQSLSLLWMILVLGTLIWAVWAIFSINKWVAIAQTPYLLWGLFALALQTALWWLNS